LSGAGRLQRHVTDFKECVVDYIIAGIAAVFLFGYLIFALLRPERF
jgi:K+-transporting ATPase KdpF subunit